MDHRSNRQCADSNQQRFKLGSVFIKKRGRFNRKSNYFLIGTKESIEIPLISFGTTQTPNPDSESKSQNFSGLFSHLRCHYGSGDWRGIVNNQTWNTLKVFSHTANYCEGFVNRDFLMAGLLCTKQRKAPEAVWERG